MYGHPRRPDPPDRWAVFDARTGGLRLFAFAEIFSFARGPLPQPEMKDGRAPQTMAEARGIVTETMQLMDALVPAFFAGTNSDPGKRRLLQELLSRAPNGLHSWERAMVPDFCDWLESG